MPRPTQRRLLETLTKDHLIDVATALEGPQHLDDGAEHGTDTGGAR